MDSSKHKQLRDEFVREANEYFEALEPLDIHPLLMWIIAIPVLMITISYLMIRGVIMVLATTLSQQLRTLVTPFVGAYFIIDTLIVAIWFFARMIKKTSEKS